ncbi:hypothetical protein BCR34DRAFT_500852 [Clohesyomyces aquaticus]|uniref:RRM domain-containing protein n=1 Tax=Clohesyomyces aquaticus TaxID=1231657 RepID=A0A1Y1Y3X7_9PLEO|nr:hypothetical protein BCR34DRAFT_500852 [Clohesyomyces aquaticus]
MSGSAARHWEQDKEATVYVGNLDERIQDHLIWELMIQAGRVRNVHLPKDRVTQTHQGFGFVEFYTEEDADYASKIMNGVRLWGKPIRVNKASADKQKTVEIGAELFIGNLDTMVAEKELYDTFSRFGPLVNIPKVARDENGLSKGYAFVSFGDFESSDTAIANMNGQYMMNKEISVQYAYKKDGKGERHGDEAERLLAKQAKAHGVTPAFQPVNPSVFQQQAAPAPSAPQAMIGGDGRGPHAAPNGPGGYGAPPPRAPASLPPPPSGLPARPPSGTPANFYPPPAGFANAPPPGFAPPMPPQFQGAPGQGPPPGFQPFPQIPPGYPPRR